MSGPKILHIDIETSPNTAYVWGMFKQNVSLSQLVDTSRTLCFAAKWHGNKKVEYYDERDGHREMIEEAWRLLDEADWVVHYNGKRFDIPTLYKEFVQYGMPPPSPIKQIDLLQTAKKQFRFPSNKLDYVAQALGLGSKVKHAGFQLWIDCMDGCPKAWKQMKRYNIQDTKLLETLYERLLPWIPQHPNFALYAEIDGDEVVCPSCGGKHHQKRGFAYTNVSKFQQYNCQSCGKWFRGRENLIDKDSRRAVKSNIA